MRVIDPERKPCASRPLHQSRRPPAVTARIGPHLLNPRPAATAPARQLGSTRPPGSRPPNGQPTLRLSGIERLSGEPRLAYPRGSSEHYARRTLRRQRLLEQRQFFATPHQRPFQPHMSPRLTGDLAAVRARHRVMMRMRRARDIVMTADNRMEKCFCAGSGEVAERRATGRLERPPQPTPSVHHRLAPRTSNCATDREPDPSSARARSRQPVAAAHPERQTVGPPLAAVSWQTRWAGFLLPICQTHASAYRTDTFAAFTKPPPYARHARGTRHPTPGPLDAAHRATRSPWTPRSVATSNDPTAPSGECPVAGADGCNRLRPGSPDPQRH